MRIAHVVWSLKIGGQERFILNLSRALVARGHDVTVISLTEGGELRREFGAIPILDVLHRGGLDLDLFVRLAWQFRKLEPDVVHTHNPAPLIYGAPAARAACVRRVVHTKHGENSVYSKKALTFARGAVHALSAFVSVSDDTASVARSREHVPERILRVVPNGIPLDEFRADPAARARVRRELAIDEDAVVVGSVGRLVVEKNYPLLVRAVAPLLSPKTRLVIVGEGGERAAIEATIAAEVPPEARAFVTLTGARSDVPDVLAALDLFVLSSNTEGLPLVVPEAMASCLPVVATAVGGLPAIVPPSVGRVVPPSDPIALRDAIADLARDPAKRRALGDAAHAHAHARFSLDRMTSEYERLYRAPAS